MYFSLHSSPSSSTAVFCHSIDFNKRFLLLFREVKSWLCVVFFISIFFCFLCLEYRVKAFFCLFTGCVNWTREKIHMQRKIMGTFFFLWDKIFLDEGIIDFNPFRFRRLLIRTQITIFITKKLSLHSSWD